MLLQTQSGQYLVQRLSGNVLTTEKVRQIDRIAIDEYGMNSLVLMENAGLQCVNWIIRRFPKPLRTVVLCGSGNNGGDGLVITRHLRLLGWNCQAFLLGPVEKFSSDTRHHARLLACHHGKGVSVITPEDQSLQNPLAAAIGTAELIIDALLGTGAIGDPRPPMADWIQWANTRAAFRLAIDVPTGVNCESGTTGMPYFKAHSTLTFVALKPAMIGLASSQLFGAIHVLPIGIPERLIEEMLVQSISPLPRCS